MTKQSADGENSRKTSSGTRGYPYGVLPHYAPFMESSSRGFLLDTRSREVVYYSPEFEQGNWHRWPNMATFLNPFVINLGLGKDWPPDSPGLHTPDPDYHPEP